MFPATTLGGRSGAARCRDGRARVTWFCSVPRSVGSCEAWEAAKRECDAVVLPYLDPLDAMERMNAIHFPGKLPEYLALGMPILMVGPACATGIKWAGRNNEAVLLPESASCDSWVAALHKLGIDNALPTRLGAAALAVGACHFDPADIRRKFL